MADPLATPEDFRAYLTAEGFTLDRHGWWVPPPGRRITETHVSVLQALVHADLLNRMAVCVSGAVVI